MRFLLVLALAAASLFGQTPVVQSGGVVNAASFSGAQPVTRGSLVSIFGSNLAAGLAQADTIPLSTTLADVSVSFNDIAAPILFISQVQINAQLPWNLLEATGGSGTANVVVRRGANASAPQQVQVGPASPGIFSTEFGIGQAIAINADGSLAARENSIPGIASHPAPIGSTIVILGTGLGAVDFPVASGQNSVDRLRRTVMTPVVLIGGREAEVAFSGLSPQFVGVNQINAVVPAGVTAGPAVPLQLRLGGITTTDRVTIAVSAP